MSSLVSLPGLRGDHPGAFLAALGLMGLLHSQGTAARLAWSDAWSPVAMVEGAGADAEAVVVATAAAMRALHDCPPLWDQGLRPNKVPVQKWHVAAQTVPLGLSPDSTAMAAWVATASDLDPRGDYCQRSALITLSGQQTLASVARNLRRHVLAGDSARLVRDAFIGPWRRVRAERMSMGWDRASVTDAATDGDGAAPAVVPVIDLLGTWALAWFPVFGARTTAMTRIARTTRFCWPLWGQPLRPAAIRVLLGAPEVVVAVMGNSDGERTLRRWGVHTVCSSERQRRGNRKTSDYAVLLAAESRRLKPTPASSPPLERPEVRAGQHSNHERAVHSKPPTPTSHGSHR